LSASAQPGPRYRTTCLRQTASTANPQGQAILGFTDYFRVEFAWAKLLGAALLHAPVPARLKEWAYGAFAITLGSATSSAPACRSIARSVWLRLAAWDS
jgi:hypothetical protein